MEDLDTTWGTWNTDRSPESFNKLMTATKPIVDKAMTSYAPGAHPAVRSRAKILVKGALESFDPSKGTKLQSHLYTQLQPLQREVQSYDTLRAPERVRLDMRHLNSAHNRFVEENDREPNDTELADFTGLSTKRIAHIRRFDRMILSESNFSPADDDADDASLPATQQAAKLWQEAVYADLGDIDKLIFDLKTGRNGRPKPLQVADIARKLKLTPSAVSQRLKRIADKIAEGARYE